MQESKGKGPAIAALLAAVATTVVTVTLVRRRRKSVAGRARSAAKRAMKR